MSDNIIIPSWSITVLYALITTTIGGVVWVATNTSTASGGLKQINQKIEMHIENEKSSFKEIDMRHNSRMDSNESRISNNESRLSALETNHTEIQKTLAEIKIQLIYINEKLDEKIKGTSK